MLPRNERLPQAAFAEAFAQGRSWRHRLLQVKAQVRGDGDLAVRAAFVVPRKLGKAVRRNRLRRRLRECYRLGPWRHEARLAGRDLIVTAQAAALEATAEELRAALEQLLERVMGQRMASLPPPARQD